MTPALTNPTPPAAPSFADERLRYLQDRRGRRARRIVGIAGALGLVAELLFDGARLGLSVPLFFGLAVAGLWAAADDEGWRQGGSARWLFVPAAFFAAMVAVRDSALLTALDVALVLGLCALAVHRFDGAAALTRLSGARLVGDAVAGLAFSLWRGPEAVLRAADGEGVRAHLARYGWPAVRALLLTGPLLLVFGVLLLLGDSQFDAKVGGWLQALELSGLLSAAAVATGSAVVLAGALMHAVRAQEGAVEEAGPSTGPLRFSDAVVPLGALSALFGVFGAVRLEAVLAFDKFAAAAREDFTYAREVHESFFALMAVVVLTLGVLLTFARFTKLTTRGERLGFAAVGTALVALTSPILVTGLSRLVLYERMYGFTEQRVVATWLVLLAGALLATRAVTLWVGAQRYGIASLAVSLAFCAGLNLLNPDQYVARQNLARPQGIVGLDLSYLTSLSADAAPEVLGALEAAGRLDEARSYRWRVRQPASFASWRWARSTAAQVP